MKKMIIKIFDHFPDQKNIVQKKKNLILEKFENFKISIRIIFYEKIINFPNFYITPDAVVSH